MRNWSQYGPNNSQFWTLENGAKANGMSKIGMVDYSPEKAGVGGSSPSLATMFSATDQARNSLISLGHISPAMLQRNSHIQAKSCQQAGAAIEGRVQFGVPQVSPGQ